MSGYMIEFFFSIICTARPSNFIIIRVTMTCCMSSDGYVILHDLLLVPGPRHARSLLL